MEHLLEVEIQQQWLVEEVLSGKKGAGTQEAVVASAVLDIEMVQSWVGVLQGMQKAGRWEVVP